MRFKMSLIPSVRGKVQMEKYIKFDFEIFSNFIMMTVRSSVAPFSQFTSIINKNSNKNAFFTRVHSTGLKYNVFRT